MEDDVVCNTQEIINGLETALKSISKAAKKRNAKSELLEKYSSLLNCYNRVLQTQLKIDNLNDPTVHGSSQSSTPRYQRG